MQFESSKNECKRSKNFAPTVSCIQQSFQNGSVPNGIVGNTLLHSCAVSNGVQIEKPLISTQSQPGKHIALHLLSKVLDDETIFNFTSIDESSSLSETFPSGSEFFTCGQE